MIIRSLFQPSSSVYPCALSDEEKEQFRSYCPPADSLFDEDTVRSVLSAADDGVAGGPSLWRNEHLKVAAETELGLAAITTIMLSMAMGDSTAERSTLGYGAANQPGLRRLSLG